MHAFLIPHSLHQLSMMLWIGHILNIVLLTFILTSQHSFLHMLRNILSPSLQNLSLTILSGDCVLFPLVSHVAIFINKFYESVSAMTLNNIVFKQLHITGAQLKYGFTALLLTIGMIAYRSYKHR